MELRDFGAEKEWPFCVELMCGTEGGVELRGTQFGVMKLTLNKNCQKNSNSVLHYTIFQK